MQISLALRRLWLLALLGAMASGCDSRPITQAEAQKAVDTWFQQYVDANPKAAERLRARALETQVQQMESLGGVVTDAEYQKMDASLQPFGFLVVGVQEMPGQNAAIADLDIGRLRQLYGRTPVTGGKATFTHYNDGRWILTAIQWDEGGIRETSNIRVR